MKSQLEDIQRYALAETQQKTSMAIFHLCKYIETLDARVKKLEDKLKGYDTLTKGKPLN